MLRLNILLGAALRRGALAAAPTRRRFRNNESGATAVEFALVATPFLAIMFAIIETAVAFWSTTVLDTAVADASRRLYTGQFQQSNAAVPAADMPTKFRDELCKNIVAMFSCASIKVDVRTYTSFPGAAPAAPVTPTGQFDAANFGQYMAPKQNDIVVVRAAVEIPVFVSLLSPRQTNLANGNRLIMGTAAFRAEPFGS